MCVSSVPLHEPQHPVGKGDDARVQGVCTREVLCQPIVGQETVLLPRRVGVKRRLRTQHNFFGARPLHIQTRTRLCGGVVGEQHRDGSHPAPHVVAMEHTNAHAHAFAATSPLISSQFVARISIAHTQQTYSHYTLPLTLPMQDGDDAFEGGSDDESSAAAADDDIKVEVLAPEDIITTQVCCSTRWHGVIGVG